MKVCAAGDRCHLKPVLVDPQHKCPTCRQHIHAIWGVPVVNSKNKMNIRMCFECFCKVGKIPDPSVSPASETYSTIYLHQSPTSTCTATTSNISGLISNTNTLTSPFSFSRNLTSNISPDSEIESEDGTASIRALYNSVADRAD